MKNTLKAFIASATLAALAAPALAADPNSYAVNSVDGSVNVKVTVQGAGSVTLPKMDASTGAALRQNLMLNNDHTMVGDIYLYNPADSDVAFFHLTGKWYRPEGSKVIYYGIDGDPTDGAASDGTYGALFDPVKAVQLPLQSFIPILFSTKIAGISPIFPTVGLKTGVIKLKLDKSGNIVSATTDMNVAGRAMVDYCKMDKAETPTCSIPKGTKDASFSFSVKSKATVEPDPT
jgi:hypothetical protein